MHCVITELLIVFSIDVYMERSSAYVGIGDGDSEGEHDRKHQSDDGLVDCFHHTIRCALFLFVPPPFVVQLLHLDCTTNYHTHQCGYNVQLLFAA